MNIQSPDEILDAYYKTGMHWKSVNRSNVLKAMQDYARQVADVAFEAGVQKEWETHNLYKPTAPNKQRFIDNLFKK